MSETAEVVVIEAGQAGVAISYLLTQAGVRHTVLERGGVGNL
jgi:cation diffusion facilitator CzcD-associated flavoprotein CzcO